MYTCLAGHDFSSAFGVACSPALCAKVANDSRGSMSSSGLHSRSLTLGCKWKSKRLRNIPLLHLAPPCYLFQLVCAQCRAQCTERESNESFGNDLSSIVVSTNTPWLGFKIMYARRLVVPLLVYPVLLDATNLDAPIG